MHRKIQRKTLNPNGHIMWFNFGLRSLKESLLLGSKYLGLNV